MNNTPTQTPIPLSNDLSVIVKAVTTQNNIVADSLCADGKNNHTMTLEDNQPVLYDITTDQFLGFFDNSSGHYFPTPLHMARLGYIAGLTVYEIITLMLKAVFESELHSKYNFIELSFMLQNEEICLMHSKQFNPDKKHLFRILELMKMPFAEAETYELFCLAVDEIVEHKIYFLSYREVENIFGKEKREEIMQLSEIQQKDLTILYITEKKRFMKQETLVSELMYALLEIKNYNKNIQDEYYRRFGDLILQYREYFIGCEVIEQKMKIKKENPELNSEQIDEKVKEFLDIKERDIRKLKDEISHSLRVLPDILFDGRREGNVQKYEHEVKKVVSELTRLLHPDLLSDEEQQKLKPEHVEELGMLWNQLLNIKKTFNFSSNQIGYLFPPLGELTQLKIIALNVFKKAGIQRGDAIPGANVEEKLSFLKKTTDILTRRAIELELEKSIHMNCAQTKIYLSVLKTAECMNFHHSELRKKVEEYKERCKTLESKYIQLFNNEIDNISNHE
jgi:hypothetical protein